MNLINQEFIHSGIIIQANAFPKKAAVRSESYEISYDEFLSEIVHVSERLKYLEIKKINLLKSDDIEFLIIFFAMSLAGVEITLFDPSWPVSLINKLLLKSNTNTIILDKNSSYKKKYSNYKTLTVEDFGLGKSTKKNIMNDLKYFNTSINSSKVFFNGFTSGSLSDPKIFSRSHKSWVKSLSMSRQEFSFSYEDKAIIPGPLSHGISLFGALDILSNGGTLNILNDYKNNKNILNTINKEEVTVIILVPTKLDLLCDAAQKSRMNSVLKIVSAGSKLSERIRKKALDIFPNAEVIEYYGASELSFVSISKTNENCPPNSVGRPFSGVSIDIRDTQGNSLRQGQVGEIWVKSHMICENYLSSSEDKKFRIDGDWATVGDIGWLDKNNFLYINKRKDNIITSSGYTIDLSSVEDKLMELPGIKEVVVTSIAHDKWGEVIVALVVPYFKDMLNEFILNEYCKLNIETYSSPKLWNLSNKIPLTSSGKVHYSLIKKDFLRNKF